MPLKLLFGKPHVWFGEPRIRHVALPTHLKKSFQQRPVNIVGEWELFFGGEWIFVQDGAYIATSRDDDVFAAAAELLIGQALTAVCIEPVTARSRFTFDLGGEIRVTPATARVAPPSRYRRGSGKIDRAQWSLWGPGGGSTTLLSNGFVADGPTILARDATLIPLVVPPSSSPSSIDDGTSSFPFRRREGDRG